MKKYKHLFFDLDGTLWDLKKNSRLAMYDVFSNHENEKLKSIDFEKFFSSYLIHNERVWELYRRGKIEKAVLRVIRFERAFFDMGFEPGKDFCNDFADRFLEICPRLPHLIEGAVELLEHCRSKYDLHIITNGFKEIQGLKMAAGGLSPYFKYVINSEDCGARKPDRVIFDYAMNLTGAGPEESLMIGDDWEADILGARNFGIDQVYISPQIESANLKRRRSRHNHRPTFAINSLHEMIQHL